MGVVGLTKTLAKEWGQFKINVNAVAFGFVETRLTAAKEEGGEMTVAERREDRARHPRADAGDGLGDHPARPPGHARGGLRPGPLPLPRRWPTTCTARCSTSPAACSGGCTPERLRGDRGQVAASRYLDVADRIWPATRRFMGLHTRALPGDSGGRLGHTIPGVPGKMLLLDHVGAKSGTKRTSPLLYFRDGDDLRHRRLQGRLPQAPGLVPQPDGQPGHDGAGRLRAPPGPRPRRRRRGARAPLADGGQGYRGYADYQARSKGREIPLVILEPRD